MLMLCKILVLQCLWFFVVLYGKTFPMELFLIGSVLFSFINFYLFRPKISLGHYIFLLILFVLTGVLHDSVLMNFSLLKSETYTWSFLSLWILFLAYYGDIFNKFEQLPKYMNAIIGAVGGSFAYLSAAKLGAVEMHAEKEILYAGSSAVMWGAFFPLSLKLFYHTHHWENFLDKTIYFSFDRSGFLRHKKHFEEDFSKASLKNKKALVTGGTSGIGQSVVNFLKSREANVFFTGRRESGDPSFIQCDLADWDAVKMLAKNCEELDFVVLNAGSMPDQYTENKNGVEFQCASQLVGHYILIHELKKLGKLKTHARIVWVSSGGMYLKKLDLSALFKNPNYDKVDTYANVKRAQVTLVEELARDSHWGNTIMTSMHPGWVKTEGLKGALTKFFSWMERRLRTSDEGADTIIWLLLTKTNIESGNFFFDRKKVSPYISKKYISSKATRLELLQKLKCFLS